MTGTSMVVIVLMKICTRIYFRVFHKCLIDSIISQTFSEYLMLYVHEDCQKTYQCELSWTPELKLTFCKPKS